MRGGDEDGTWTRPAQALGIFLRGHTLRTAIPVAAIVGTVISAVNQGVVIADGSAGPAVWVWVVVNYLVPFVVSSIGYLSARRVPPP